MSEGRAAPPAASIRPWTVEDIPDVRRIGWDTWKATYGAFVPEADLRAYHDEHYSPAALLERFRRPATRGYMGLLESAPAGYMLMSCDAREEKCSVSSIYIDPGCQGHGLGSMLMREAFRVARSSGFDRVWLGVMSQNTPTLNWYRSLGFTFVREEPFTMGRTTVLHYIGYRLVTPSDLPNHAPAAHDAD